jgi:large subunit ribosomal protein L24e
LGGKEMTKCVFCGKDEKEFKGVHYLKNDGSVNYFCTTKCQKNALKLKRDKRKIRWTEAFHIKREKARAKVKLAEDEKAGKKKEEVVEKKIMKEVKVKKKIVGKRFR